MNEFVCYPQFRTLSLALGRSRPVPRRGGRAQRIFGRTPTPSPRPCRRRWSPDRSDARRHRPRLRASTNAEFLARTANPRCAKRRRRSASRRATPYRSVCPNPGFFTSSPQWAGSISQYNWVFTQDFITAHKLGSIAPWRSAKSNRRSSTSRAARFEVLTSVRKTYYTTAAAQRRVEVLDGTAGRFRPLARRRPEAAAGRRNESGRRRRCWNSNTTRARRLRQRRSDGGRRTEGTCRGDRRCRKWRSTG